MFYFLLRLFDFFLNIVGKKVLKIDIVFLDILLDFLFRYVDMKLL